MDTDSSSEGFENWIVHMQSVLGRQSLEAVVGGMAGELEGEDGLLAWSPNLPKWKGVAVRRRMRETFSCPIYIMNDVTIEGMGEAYDGAGTVRGVMAYFTVSTGVNAVRLVDGKIDPTIDEFELGAQLVEESGAAKSPVSLESMIGGGATQKRSGQRPRDIDDPRLWQMYSATLARAVYNTVLYWTPDVIVFGGSMMRDIDVAAVAKQYKKLPQVLHDRPKLVRARLGDLAGLYGALRWWQDRQK